MASRPQPPSLRNTGESIRMAIDAVMALLLSLLSGALRVIAWLLQRPSSRD